MQGPSAKSMFADRPYTTTAAYHIKNASNGYFEPAQQGDSFFAHSTSKSPAFISTLLGDREVNWIGGTTINGVLMGSGGRRSYNAKNVYEVAQQMSAAKRKLKKLVEKEFRKKFKASKKALNKMWYKKAQIKSPQNISKKLGLEGFLFFSERDLLTAIRNIGYRSGGYSQIRATLPKLFFVPFSVFKSIAAVKAYSKETGLKAVPLTTEIRELIEKMGLRLP
jgi:hypothetical protein